ncbi:hypothetical protein C8J57DRAFT_1240767 [Mycena rebaudengoi]|nr:hypothetical protein C8J57DRAFT_1240767 [Mycena rebaudengoi]
MDFDQNSDGETNKPEAAHGANELILSSFRDVPIDVPGTASDAEQLLHLVRSHRDVCELERNLALKRLHQTLIYPQVLRQEIDKAGKKLSAADDDVGKVRAAIRTKGLRGVRFGNIEHDSDFYLCCEGIVEDA